ncbi:AraC family transcriptional regulator [Inquilinus limosus]|uniref:helix-turn-helix domain-containing protein n=1 Tax=Inquilinus limosus TaxID=171674 RepID=UPI003F17C91E
MLSPTPRGWVVLGEGEPQLHDAPAGGLVLIPAARSGSLTWPAARESVIIVLTPESLQELAEHEFGMARVELQPPPFGTADPWALRIAQMLKAELSQRGAPNPLYVDSLVTLFGIHLLRQYAGVRVPPPVVRGGLPARSARQVQEYLAESFSRKVSVAELAAVAGLSPHHFIQAFTRTFGEPPHRYVIGLRLTFAEKLLVEGELTIAEVAYLSGFSSQSHLTTAMRKYRQTTPRKIRREGSSSGASSARSDPMPGR